MAKFNIPADIREELSVVKIPEKPVVNEKPKEKAKKQTEKPAKVIKKPDPEPNEEIKILKAEQKSTVKSGKHPGGRKNIRGEKGKDYQMFNISVPMEVYDRLKEISNEKTAGNMTFLVNSILREYINK